jgi:hypothetical protein
LDVISQYGLVIAAAGAALLLALLVWWFIARRRGPELARALEAVAIERLQNVLLPDGMGGQIQVEHLVLTGHGFLIIDAKAFAGSIFASERMAEWTVISKQGRFTFPNPLGTLYDRVAALRQLVRDVPVAGFVLFDGSADFTKGRPRDVLSAAELMERYRRPDAADLERLMVAFQPHWERVKGAIEPASRR